jgi:hypothetical protein
MIMTMSTYEALEAWQAGEITASRAMVLTGACDLLDLHALAAECEVELRVDLLPSEKVVVENAITAIDRQIANENIAVNGLKIA